MKPRHRFFGSEVGGIFIMVLFSIVLLGFFIQAIFVRVSQRISFAKRFRQQTQLFAVVTSAAPLIQAALAEDEAQAAEGESYDALQDVWSRGGERYFKDVPVGAGRLTVAVDDPREEGGAAAGPGLEDEARKINLNEASEEVLERLFREAAGLGKSESSEIAASILDWRDQNSAIHLGGAEGDYYQSLSPPYDSKDAPFEWLEELLFVKGIDDDIFDKVRSYVTVYSQGKVNINTATEVVLRALGCGDSLTAKILDFRAGSDRMPGTSDDGVFKTKEAILSTLSAAKPLDVVENSQLLSLMGSGLLTVESTVFTAHIRARVEGREKRVDLVMTRDRRSLAWRTVSSYR